MKIGLVHDYLNQQGGAERVVAVLHEIYPDALIHTLFVDADTLWPPLKNADISPSVLQFVPFVMRKFKMFFWLYPFIIMNKRVRDCDVIISSSSAYAKGIRIPRNPITGEKPVHICYCHTPMRFAWDYDRYIANETKSKWLSRAARLFVPLLKFWDVYTARNVDHFIANSTAVQKRIREYYDRDSTVIYPPVEMKQLVSRDPVPVEDYFLIVSRLVSYKRLNLAVEACTEMGVPLIVIGRGPDLGRLQALAGPTVQFLGFQPDEEVVRYMAHCKALIFPGEEDFGMAPLEVNSLGRPAVAFAGGGALDTIVEGLNGVFFHEPSVQALCRALERIEEIEWISEEIRAAALRFERRVFEEQLTNFVCEVALDNATPTEQVGIAADGGVAL